MGQLWSLVESYRDGQQWPPSYRAMAGRMGVTPTAFTNWRTLSKGRLPDADHLRALAVLIGVPYSRVLDAALIDTGYYGKAHHDGTPKTQADPDVIVEAGAPFDPQADAAEVQPPAVPDQRPPRGSQRPRRA